MKVYHEGDKVVLDLGGRVRDVLLTCGQAEEFEHALRRFADRAELEPPELVQGEQWKVKVESYDGFVAVRVYSPFGSTATRVRVPVEAARQMADIVSFKRQQAAYKMRFIVARN